MQIMFKFKHAAPPQKRAQIMEELAASVGVPAAPLFPSASDDLADVYAIEVAPKRVHGALELLGSLKDVEYAEREPARKLV